MKQFVFSLLLLLTSGISLAQTGSDSIEIKQRLGKVFLQHGKLLSTGELYSILNSTDESEKEVTKAKANLAPMYIFSYAGGFMIGWTLGTAIAHGKPQWALAAGGAALICCAIPFQIGYNHHILKAVTIYNSSLKKIGLKQPVFEFGLSRQGFGFEINF